MYRTKELLWKSIAVPFAATLLLVGCASGADTGSGAATDQLSEGMRGATDSGDPVSGGALSFGAYSEPAALDPAVAIAAVTTGGIEMLNIYDSLLRFDTESNEFVPQMAQSLDHDDDFRTWTLTLRDGVKFSNNMPVDAAAVKASQERYAAKPAPEAALWNDSVESIETSGDKTVTYTLNKSWADFPGLLTTGPGMIVSTESDGPDGKFTPIGAGPFTLATWAQADSMTLSAREDYWAGEPNLDALRIVYLPGTQVGLETMYNGGIDSTFVREPDEVDEVVERGMSGYVNMTAAGNAALINASEGRPGADPRVRQAMQLAVDPQIITQRAFDDPDLGNGTIFPEYSRWHTQTRATPVAPEKAKQLLAEAMADGYDGKLEVIDASDPASQQTALAVEAQLEAVGFDVRVNLMPTIGDQVRTIAKERNYDLAAWGLAYRESDPFPKMQATMHSEGKQVYGMYTSPEMDSLIDELQLASDKDKKAELVDQIQQQVNKDVPYLVYSSFAEFVVWNPTVHGVVGSSNSMVLFGTAWKS